MQHFTEDCKWHEANFHCKIIMNSGFDPFFKKMK